MEKPLFYLPISAEQVVALALRLPRQIKEKLFQHLKAELTDSETSTENIDAELDELFGAFPLDAEENVLKMESIVQKHGF
jgi:hypothetical protein